VSERDFQAAVVEAARLLGWRVAHFRPARTAQGWRTPVQADGAGFPDLIAVRGPRLIAAELKSERGKLRPEQAQWLEAFQAAGAEARIWRPDDWAAIEERLR
jgi:VRR-NUC domain